MRTPSLARRMLHDGPWPSALSLWLRIALGLALLVAALPSSLVLSQVTPGASLTVVRGSVAVSRPDGTAVYPAGTGLTLAVGDTVGTLERTRAIVTFFIGNEIELGSNTTITIRQLDRNLLDQTNITIQQVSGLSVTRMDPSGNPDSSIRVISADTVAVQHAGEVGHAVDPSSNNITAVCFLRCGPDSLAFPSETMFARASVLRPLTGRGDLIDERFPAGASVWDVMSDAASLGVG